MTKPRIFYQNEAAEELIGDKDYERAVELFHDGLAPSQIDAKLNLAEGTAHYYIVRHWLIDRMR